MHFTSSSQNTQVFVLSAFPYRSPEAHYNSLAYQILCGKNGKRQPSSYFQFTNQANPNASIAFIEPIIINVLAAGAAAITALITKYFQSREQSKSEKKILEAENVAREHPERSKPAWDLARATLEAYFNRNLRQISMIFWLSVFVMLVGFGIICSGIVVIMQQPQSVTNGIVTASAGVLTEFVGATFLLVYRSTIQQANEYCQTLERINSVGMAMQILDTMPDQVPKEDLKSLTKAKLVETLAGRSVSSLSVHPTTRRSKKPAGPDAQQGKTEVR